MATIRRDPSGRRRRASPTWHFIGRLFREKPLGAIGGVVFLLFLFCGIFADVLAPYGMNQINPINRLKPPSWAFPFGTDNLGRDMLSRCLYGAQLSVIIGFCGAGLATLISVVLGIVTGYLGGKVDLIVQRFVDAWQSFPDLIVLIVVVSVVGPGMPQIIVTLGLLLGIAGSRIIRTAVVSVRENMYVHAAQSIGASTSRILWRHIFPNVLPPDHRAVHDPRRRRHPDRVGAVVPGAGRAAAGADLGRHAVGQRSHATCSRARGWRWRRACA